jgi:hypothetical protein
MPSFRDAKGRFLKGIQNPWQFTAGPSGNHWIFGPAIRELFDRWNTILRTLTGARDTTMFGHMVIDMDPHDFREMMRRTQRIQHTREAIPPALREIGTYVAGNVIPRMFEEGDATGAGGMSMIGWEDLKESTNKWRAEHDFPQEHPILIASGALYNAATSPAAIHVDEHSRTPHVSIGGSGFSSPEKEKFYVHMGGGNFGWQGSYIPPRPFVPTSPDDLTREEKNDIDRIFQRHLEHFLEA